MLPTIALGITDAELRMQADMKGMLMDVNELISEKLKMRGMMQEMEAEMKKMKETNDQGPKT